MFRAPQLELVAVVEEVVAVDDGDGGDSDRSRRDRDRGSCRR